MPPKDGHSVLTYQTDDGSASEDVWYSMEGIPPHVITLANGRSAALVNSTPKGRNFTPPSTMRRIVDQSTAPPPVPTTPGVHSHLGWPGVPVIVDGS
jgi:hypothetical protein